MGRDHTRYIGCLFGLAACLQERCRRTEALQAFEECMHLRERV